MKKIEYEAYQKELKTLRRYLHQRPELSMEEWETAAFITQYLKDLGLSPKRIDENGVTAMIWAPKEETKTVLIRAEMDAVAVQEGNPVEWKSQKEGVMHACGHDGNMAVLLVLAKICQTYREDLPVNVKFLFQPAEENGQGTQLMLDGGIMEHPLVDDYIMFHFANDAPCGVEFHRGESTAAIGSMILKVKGKATHWSSAKAGVDAIYGAARVIEVIHKINETYHSEFPFVAGIGIAEGGKAKNVVAEEVVLQGTLRASVMEDYKKLRILLLEEFKKVEAETGTRIEVEIDEEPIPPIVNDEELVDLGLQVGKSIWGKDCRLVTQKYLSGDSAAYYFDYARGVFMVFTAQKQGENNYPLHSGLFDFEEDVLWRTTATLHQFLLQINKKK